MEWLYMRGFTCIIELCLSYVQYIWTVKIVLFLLFNLLHSSFLDSSTCRDSSLSSHKHHSYIFIHLFFPLLPLIYSHFHSDDISSSVLNTYPKVCPYFDHLFLSCFYFSILICSILLILFFFNLYNELHCCFITLYKEYCTLRYIYSTFRCS